MEWFKGYLRSGVCHNTTYNIIKLINKRHVITKYFFFILLKLFNFSENIYKSRMYFIHISIYIYIYIYNLTLVEGLI